MSYLSQTGKTIDQSFKEFHRKNPVIYELFCKYAKHLLETVGKKKTSSKLLINRIRWEMTITTTGNDYKINDAFTSRYARLYIKDFPQHATKFELRELRTTVKYEAGEQLSIV